MHTIFEFLYRCFNLHTLCLFIGFAVGFATAFWPKKRQRAILCIWCGKVIPYKKKDLQNIVAVMKNHDFLCQSNPLVRKIAELQKKVSGP